VATILRDWSYQHQWLYDTISRLAAVSVGGEGRFRRLPLQGVEISPQTRVLDLCCGAGQSTRWLVRKSQDVVGLDASPLSIQRAQKQVPEATYVEGFAEELPFTSDRFDVVHTCVAMHEMTPKQRRQIFQEVYRVLAPGGIFTMLDFHSPATPVLWPGLALFMWLFETETAWQMLQENIPEVLANIGFHLRDRRFHAFGSLQTIQAQKLA